MSSSPAEDRLPPQDLEAEQATLGAMLIDPEAAERAFGIVGADDFYPEAHQTIFAAMLAVRNGGGAPLDVVTVGAELRAQDVLEIVGGGEYLTALIGEVPTTAHVIRYATIVRERGLARQAIADARVLVEELYTDPDDVLNLVAAHETATREIGRAAMAVSGPGAVTADVMMDAVGETTWLWPGWVPRGYLSVLAGETGIGKSKLALRIVDSHVSPTRWPDGQPGPDAAGTALFCDTEGAQSMHGERIAAAGLPAERIYFPGRDGLADLALDEPATLGFVRHEHEQHGHGLVIADSLRTGIRGDENSSEFAAALTPWAQLARDLAIAIVLVHHAGKPRAGGDHEMTLDRLRGSSAIVALPRAVIGIDRPDAADPNLRVQMLKSNLAREREPFGMTVTEHGCDPAPLPRCPRRASALGDAEEFLEDTLLGGARPLAELLAQGGREGINEAAIHRARKSLGIVSLRDPNDQRARLWGLPQRGGGA